MKVAMGILAIGATFLGALQIPFVTEVITKFLEPTFEQSSTCTRTRPTASSGSA